MKGNFFEIRDEILYITFTSSFCDDDMDLFIADLHQVNMYYGPGRPRNTLVDASMVNNPIKTLARDRAVNALKPLSKFPGNTAIVVKKGFVKIALTLIITMAGTPRTKMFDNIEEASKWIEKCSEAADENQG